MPADAPEEPVDARITRMGKNALILNQLEGEGGELADMTPAGAQRRSWRSRPSRTRVSWRRSASGCTASTRASSRRRASGCAPRTRPRSPGCAPTSRTRRRRRAAPKAEVQAAPRKAAREAEERAAREGAAQRDELAALRTRVALCEQALGRVGEELDGATQLSAELLSGSPHSAELARHLENAQTIVNASWTRHRRSGRRRSRSRSPLPRRVRWRPPPRRQSPRRRRPSRRRPGAGARTRAAPAPAPARAATPPGGVARTGCQARRRRRCLHFARAAAATRAVYGRRTRGLLAPGARVAEGRRVGAAAEPGRLLRAAHRRPQRRLRSV